MTNPTKWVCAKRRLRSAPGHPPSLISVSAVRMKKFNIKYSGLQIVHLSLLMTKTNKMSCAPSEYSDQPGHWPSLIRVFAVRMKKVWVLSYPLSAQRRPSLIRLCGCPGWPESSLGAQSLCWFCHVAAHVLILALEFESGDTLYLIWREIYYFLNSIWR